MTDPKTKWTLGDLINFLNSHPDAQKILDEEIQKEIDKEILDKVCEFVKNNLQGEPR